MAKQPLSKRNLKALALPGPERYHWFVAQVLHTGIVWMAESDQLTLMRETSDGVPLLPVWPSAEIAQFCFSEKDIAEGYHPVARPLDEWLEHSTPALIDDGVRLAICPNQQYQAVIVLPEYLRADLVADSGSEAREQDDEQDQEGQDANVPAIGLSADSKMALERFVKRVREGGKVWMLRNGDGYRVCESNDAEADVFPVWSDRAYAQRCAIGDWRDSTPVSVPVEAFVEHWLPNMAKDGALAGPNWNGQFVGKEVPASELLKMLT